MTSNPHGLVLPPELNPRGRRRRTKAARVLSWVAVITSACVLVGSVGVYAFVKYFDGRINRIGICPKTQPDCHKVKKGPGKSVNFLLIGSDSREGATSEELKKASTTFTPGRRSDTLILIHLSANEDKALMVSFPRDSWVAIPGKGHDRINAAFSAGGVTLAVQTVEQLTQLHIDHYIEVNFAGFQRIVEAVKGVDVCLPTAQKDKDSGIDLPAGKSHVNGQQALAFVRQRNGLPRGDIDRIARQQQFMGALMRRATSLGVLANPVRLVDFLTSITDAIQVDDNLSFGQLKDLALRLRGLDPAKVTFVTAPNKGNARREGKAVVLLDELPMKALFDSLRNDTAIPGASPAPVPTDLIVPASKIRVQVLNGTDTKGVANGAATELRGIGFLVQGTGNADSPTYERTIVRYGPQKSDSARTLAAATGADLQLDQSLGRTLELVIGRNYAGARAVTISTARPTPSGSSSLPPATSAADDPCAA